MNKLSNRTVVCMLASLLLAIFISIMAIMLSVKLGFASNNSVMNSMNEVDYYQMVYSDFMKKCESLAIPNGLSKEVFDGVVSVEQIRSDGNGYLKAELNSSTFQINIEGYSKKLSDNIYAYVEENDLTADGNVDEIIAGFCDEIMDYYLEIIRLPYAATIGVVFRTISDYFPYVFIAMLVLSLATIWVLVKQNPHKRNRIFRYMAYSTMSGAFSTLIVPIFCIVTRFYRKLQIYPEYMYKFIVRYIEDGINIMLIIGIILLITSIVMICLSSYIKYQYKHMNDRKHETGKFE